MLFPKLENHQQLAVTLLNQELDKHIAAMEQENAKEALAKRQANAAVALLRMSQPQKVWPMFKHSAGPRGRSYLLQRLALLGADLKELNRRLWVEPDVSSRRALLLVLGELGKEKFLASERDSLVAKVLDLYRDDPDPGLHGAAEWLLRQWKQAEKLKQIDNELASPERNPARPQRKLGIDPNQRRWYVNGQRQTMVLIPGPVEFWMGSPTTEADRLDGPKGKTESRHKKRIGRTFAIAAKEVTVEQFLRYFPSHDYNKQYSPSSDCPVNLVTWYEAALWVCVRRGL